MDRFPVKSLVFHRAGKRATAAWHCTLYSESIVIHQQIKEDLVRQYGAHVVDTTGYTLTIPYEQLYPVVVSPRAYITVTLVIPDVT
jgi:hypothetical protein